MVNFFRRVSEKLPAAAQMAFFGSLLLSLLAVVNSPTINRDGILYVETARAFLQGGFSATLGLFDWPFFPILMGVVARFSGIDIETTGLLLNALFMAGACALVVSSSERTVHGSGAWVCLAVLALPGLNRYREELLREYGCWFFVMLSFWTAIRWSETQRWLHALIAQSCLLFAFLFRPEALAFFPALFLWQLFDRRKEAKLRRLLMISALPMIGAALLFGGYLFSSLELSGRLASVLTYFSPDRKVALFDGKANALAAALIPYARDQADTILLWGSLALIPLKFVRQLGVFLVPLLLLFQSPGLRFSLTRTPVFAWGFCAHLVVLALFVIDQQFLAGRYVAVLSLLAVPFVGIGLMEASCRYPRLKLTILVVSGVLMLSNVVSLNLGQNYFASAGKWLATNAANSSRVYVEGSRTAYYAGWDTRRVFPKERREQLGQSLPLDNYDIFALEVSRRDADTDTWLKSRNLKVAEIFKNSRNDSVVIAIPEGTESR